MIATIGRMTTVMGATSLRHIAKAQDERKIQSCGVRIADGGMVIQKQCITITCAVIGASLGV